MRTEKMLRATGKFNPDANEGIISGVAVVFNSVTTLSNIGGYSITEEISDGACDKALERGDDVRCLFNHDPNKVLGRTTAGTLKLWKEADGLHFECQTDTGIQWQSDLCRQIKRGDISQCSFAFRIDNEECIDGEQETHYIVKDLHLYDVSVVTYPAYSDTTAKARSEEQAERDATAGLTDKEMLQLMELEISIK